MTHDKEHFIEEAEYEIVNRRNGKLQVEIVLPGRKHPIQHGVSIQKARRNSDGIQAEIEERVRRIAARQYDPGIPEDEEIQEKGSVEFDPRTRDGRPKEQILEPDPEPDADNAERNPGGAQQ